MPPVDAAFEAHPLEVDAVLAGWFWACGCGASSQPFFESKGAAMRDAESHVREMVGLQAARPLSDSEVLPMLSRLCESNRLVDPDDLAEFGTFSDIMDVLDALDRRGWITTSASNRGDDRLLSARGVAPTSAGRAALKEALSTASDLLDMGETESTSQEPLVQALTGVEGKRAGRAQFMNRLYDVVDGSRALSVDAKMLGSQLQWADSLTVEVVRYLSDEGLLERKGWGGPVSITHAGVQEVEQLRTTPDEPTVHFPPFNVVIVGGDNYGQIQSGTTNSHQSQTNNDSVAIATFLAELGEALQEASIDPTVRGLVEANIAEVTEALAAEGPGATRVRRLVPSLKDFGVNMAASGAFLGLTEAAANLPPFA